MIVARIYALIVDFAVLAYNTSFWIPCGIKQCSENIVPRVHAQHQRKPDQFSLRCNWSMDSRVEDCRLKGGKSCGLPKVWPLSAERLASLSNLLVNRIRLASHPRSVKLWWCSSSSNLEFDESRFVKEALLTSDDEEIREQPMADNQGKM